jgi:hypothetical protein
MTLSLSDVARLLGKSERQVRYMVKTGRLAGRKEGAHWVFDRDALPLSQGQTRAQDQKAARALAIAQDVLGPAAARPDGAERMSLRQLTAMSEGLRLHATVREALGIAHPAAMHLRESLAMLGLGFHAFHGREKATHFGVAREQASRAVVELLIHGGEADALALAIEASFIPAIGGLVRRAERRGRP